METFVFVAIVCAGLIGWFVVTRAKSTRYRRKAVLTGSERDLFFRLRNALPECHVCPRVAISALIEPAGMGQLRRRAIASMGGKRVGYAIFDDEMELLAVVELAYRTHPTRAEKFKESCLASAGIRTVRFHARHLPSEGKIRSSIFVRKSTDRRARVDVHADSEFEFRKTPWTNTVNIRL